MKTKNIVVLIIAVSFIVILFYSFSGSQNQAPYIDQIKAERKDKNNYMRTSKDSPFKGKTDQFNDLKYFEPDLAYKVSAELTPIQNRKTIVLTTSDGKEEHYLEYAFADFHLLGKDNKLLILEVMEDGAANRGQLFLAFGDETSAVETYGAGRYLDVSKNEGSNSITLDFNKAYNPYCAYVDDFSCPLPPKENLLTIAIKAGEKTYKP